MLIAIELYIFVTILFPHQLNLFSGNRVESISPASACRRRLVLGGVLIAVIAVAPLVPWAIRNWKVFGGFQPLAPRYANEEDEFVPMGFNRWVKTWITDYTSVEEVYWQEPGSPIDPSKLPSRAFDTPRQQRKTEALISDYNQVLHVTPELDKTFAALAAERIREHPIRYYLGLPMLRIADMWLRPRTEMLPCDSRWWEFNDDLRWLALAIFLGTVNLFYVAGGLLGWMYSRKLPLTGVLVLFVVLRSVFLVTLENPEPRYTLEMYPIVIVLAAYALARKTRSGQPSLSLA